MLARRRDRPARGCGTEQGRLDHTVVHVEQVDERHASHHPHKGHDDPEEKTKRHPIQRDAFGHDDSHERNPPGKTCEYLAARGKTLLRERDGSPMADDDAEDSYTDDGPEAAAAAARPAPTSEPAPPRVPPLPPTITTSGPSDAKRAKKAAPAPAAAREDGGGPDAGELPDKGDDDWTPTEVAQFKKAMIVLGNKAWRDMTVYLPQRSHKALNRKYKDLGGSWGEVLKPHIREHRWLKKAREEREERQRDFAEWFRVRTTSSTSATCGSPKQN